MMRRTNRKLVWDPAPTRLFLKLWLEYIYELRGPRLNAHIHKEIAAKMSKYGLKPAEIKAKLDNMTKRYKAELRKIRATGQESKWPQFKNVHEILNEDNSHLCMADSIDFADHAPMEDSDSSYSDYYSKSPNKPNNVTKEPRSTTKIPERSTERSPERGTERSPERNTERSPGTSPVRSDSPLEMTFKPASSTLSNSERKLAIEKAKLDIQKENLKFMKNIADELSSLNRKFLQIYKYKY